MQDFETLYPERKYLTDFKMFLRESKLEDFIAGSNDTVFVGTIHKSKGKEFDSIYLMLDQPKIKTAEEARQLYVAITRAKSNLIIHYNGDFLNHIKTEALVYRADSREYDTPDELVMQTSHFDIHLDYFLDPKRQHLISELRSGDPLRYNQGYCLNQQGQNILRFSRKFLEKISNAEKIGYEPSMARVRFVVYWKKEDTKQECQLVLPQLHFRRK
jgi:ATP-dependent DNA helicase RecQ